jgi:uncharacterized membrane protein YidH (DUF202 family)
MAHEKDLMPEPDSLERPARAADSPLPPIPEVDLGNPRTSNRLSLHRTDLSTRRTEMSMRRTGMSIQRTRMSADRTMMSVIRTSLSLIGFGFTLAQLFQKLVAAGTVKRTGAPEKLGLALVLLGVGLLAFGLIYHLSFMYELRKLRSSMKVSELVHADSHFPVSLTTIVAILLMLIGMSAAWVVLGGIGS